MKFNKLMTALLLAGGVSAVMAAPSAAGNLEGPRSEKNGQEMRHREGVGPRELTKEQYLKGAEQRFDEMDANKDGRVTPEEHRAAFDKMREKFGRGGPRPEFRHHGILPGHERPEATERGTSATR